MLSNRDKGTGAEGSSSAATEASSTCQAWKITRTAINAVPALPAGWDWDTPGIDIHINNQATAVETALALFEPKIADEPADVAAAARAHIGARPIEDAALRNRTFTGNEATPMIPRPIAGLPRLAAAAQPHKVEALRLLDFVCYASPAGRARPRTGSG